MPPSPCQYHLIRSRGRLQPSIIDSQQGNTYAPLSIYSNDALWVEMPHDGPVFAHPDPDGWQHDNFGTVRLISGTLTARGQRLNGPAVAGRASIPDGYGMSGFQSFTVRNPLRDLPAPLPGDCDRERRLWHCVSSRTIKPIMITRQVSHGGLCRLV